LRSLKSDLESAYSRHHGDVGLLLDSGHKLCSLLNVWGTG
jgi:hypothetical protein